MVSSIKLDCHDDPSSWHQSGSRSAMMVCVATLLAAVALGNLFILVFPSSRLTSSYSPTDHTVLLQHQVQLQTEFQELVQRNQNPVSHGVVSSIEEAMEMIPLHDTVFGKPNTFSSGVSEPIGADPSRHNEQEAAAGCRSCRLLLLLLSLTPSSWGGNCASTWMLMPCRRTEATTKSG